MFAVIEVAGLRVEAEVIPKKAVVSLWKTLTKKAFPKVKVYQIGDADFESIVELSKTRDDEKRELKEWGRVLPPEGTDAIVYDTDEFPDVDYVILIRDNPYHSLSRVVKHELSHIAKGDL
jgi:hypothetical protein